MADACRAERRRRRPRALFSPWWPCLAANHFAFFQLEPYLPRGCSLLGLAFALAAALNRGR